MCSKKSENLKPKNVENTQTPENNVKEELGNVERQTMSISKDLNSVKKMKGVEGFDSSTLNAKLLILETKFEESKEKIERLREDYILSTERENRAAIRYSNLREDHCKMISEKNKTISELKDKIEEMENLIQEKDDTIEACKQKISCSEAVLVQMNDEIQNLERQKVSVEQNVDELRKEQLEFQQRMKESRRRNLEACRTIERLKRRKSEADKIGKGRLNSVEHLASRIARVEEEFAAVLGIEVDDIKNFLDEHVGVGENEIRAFKCKDLPQTAREIIDIDSETSDDYDDSKDEDYNPSPEQDTGEGTQKSKA
ncbi:uncharacterized protein LOC127257106 isoform X2 [Andrographis paniculata]|uniref:uncharacterized protein LOC127257106 isoform X2 n=1 Tax=Andrographis paniculata TaxID=175694 RepID=UPI0021E79142|nr:uncharacterized protein LOC127257106 isoform X2 [Andrographis paniculata]